MIKIAILDYGVGNLFSIQTALEKIGVTTIVTSELDANLEYDGIILPGVGGWKHAVKRIQVNQRILNDYYENNKPILGVCLGMQLFFEKSAEGPGDGLGFFEGEIMFFSNNVKVPHIGWNTLKQNNKDRILDGVEDQSWAYFVHSLYPKPTDSKIISTTTDYGIEFTSMVNKNNIFGTQFHPEKSGKAGARILENFVSVCGNL
ncbi:MAG TPA: imidazole glycerol phosphate synthase subunit HisH [Nitrososphaerales archaeon]|nr:imidazole glycerol phosphate synthase subunit HisH [Nitrososphaerales archaeon]